MQGKIRRIIKVEFGAIKEEIANNLFDRIAKEFSDATWEMEELHDNWYFITGVEEGTYYYSPATYWEPADYEDTLCVEEDDVYCEVKDFAKQFEDENDFWGWYVSSNSGEEETW